MNKTIALDIGNVCLKLRPDLCLGFLGLSSLEEIPPEFMIAVDKMERGFIDQEEWLEVFQKVSENKYSDDELIHAWNLLIGEEMDGMAELVKEITGKGYRFVYFSDTSRPHILHMYRHLSFANLVSGGIFSYDVGAKKPEDGMYEAFEREHGVPCFYLDDRENNVEAGKKRGWKSHLFTDAENFKKEFYALVETGNKYGKDNE
jgi:FMN phosphatase YigB (HAD superfamily)